jgi:hypothetical protein
VKPVGSNPIELSDDMFKEAKFFLFIHALLPFITYTKPETNSYDKDYQRGDEEPCCSIKNIF